MHLEILGALNIFWKYEVLNLIEKNISCVGTPCMNKWISDVSEQPSLTDRDEQKLLKISYGWPPSVKLGTTQELFVVKSSRHHSSK